MNSYQLGNKVYMLLLLTTMFLLIILCYIGVRGLGQCAPLTCQPSSYCRMSTSGREGTAWVMPTLRLGITE
jgi:hypothetical protein